MGGQDRTALATYYRERAAAELDNVLSLIDWQDLNLDGDVQQNEVDVAASQQLARQVGSTLTDSSVVLFAEDNAPYPLDRARVTDQR